MANVDVNKRECVNGVNPDARYRVPVGYGDFYQALDLQDIADALIDARFSLWPKGEGKPTIAYFWKRKGGARSGKGVYGKLSKATGLVGALLGTEYVLWLAADHVKDLAFTNYQVEALLYHEMCHISLDLEEQSDGSMTLKYSTKGHDVEEFTEVISAYGLWEPDLKLFSRIAARQLSLLEPATKSNGHKATPDDKAAQGEALLQQHAEAYKTPHAFEARTQDDGCGACGHAATDAIHVPAVEVESIPEHLQNGATGNPAADALIEGAKQSEAVPSA